MKVEGRPRERESASRHDGGAASSGTDERAGVSDDGEWRRDRRGKGGGALIEASPDTTTIEPGSWTALARQSGLYVTLCDTDKRVEADKVAEDAMAHLDLALAGIERAEEPDGALLSSLLPRAPHRTEIHRQTLGEPLRKGRRHLVPEPILAQVWRCSQQELEPLFAPSHDLEETLVDGPPDHRVDHVQRRGALLFTEARELGS